MLKERIKTAAWITVIMVVILLCSGISWVLPVTAALLSLTGCYELLGITAKHTRPCWIRLCLILAVVIPLTSTLGGTWSLAVVFASAVLYFSFLMNRKEHTDLDRPWKLLLIVVTISVFFRSMPQLRQIQHGFWYLILAMLCCVVTDTGAYFVGRKFGKHPLAPRISPKKTLEGSIGGGVLTVICMTVLSALIGAFSDISIHYAKLTIWALLGTVVAQFGDLSMSVIKRIVGAKDYSNLLPGHGGVLDRFDSTLFVIPYTLLYIHYIGGFLI